MLKIWHAIKMPIYWHLDLLAFGFIGIWIYWHLDLLAFGVQARWEGLICILAVWSLELVFWC